MRVPTLAHGSVLYETMADEECEESAKMSGHTNWTQIKL